MQLWITILEQINIFEGELISIINGQNIRGVILVGYLVLLAILVYIHSKFLKKQKKSNEVLTEIYDTIRYTLAKIQYENPSMQNNKGITILREANHKNYPANEKVIKQEILSIEQQRGQKIIPQKQRDTLSQQTHKKNRLTNVVQIIGRIITIITIGIYKVFW